MTVKELTKKCYDTIIIYINADDECTEFKDLFKGKKGRYTKRFIK